MSEAASGDASAAARPVTTTIRGLRLYSVEAGPDDAPPVLLLHGLGASVTRWVDVVSLLAERFRVIALDLPGFGRSDAPRARYSTAWLAGAVGAFLRERGIERASIVGNSLGGTVALRLAATASERCDALVLVGAALPGPGLRRPSLRGLAQYALPVVPLVGEAMYETYMLLPAERRLRDSLTNICGDPSRVRAATREVLLQEMRERPGRADLRRSMLSAQRSLMAELFLRGRALWAVAAGLRVPTMLLWGERDRVVPAEVARLAAATIPGAELVVLPGAGHAPQIEVPHEFAMAVAQFLDRVSGDRASRAARG